MRTVQSQLMTAEEFYEWTDRPENRDKRRELERGAPVEMPPPEELHRTICSLITDYLRQYVFQRNQGHVCSNDTGLIVEKDPDTHRGPDVMLFLERKKTEDLSPKYPELTPKLIVEVLSPTDRMANVHQRLAQFFQVRVEMAWVVDSTSQSLTIFRSDKQLQYVENDRELLVEDVLPGFRHCVSDFFKLPGETEDSGKDQN